MGYALLGQIPIVQSIRESGDEGVPVALNADSITGMGFFRIWQIHLVAAVDKRNRELPPTRVVNVRIKVDARFCQKQPNRKKNG